jgi:hypothetical protein
MQMRGSEPEREREREIERKRDETGVEVVTRRPRWCDFRRDNGVFWRVKTGLFGGIFFRRLEAALQWVFGKRGSGEAGGDFRQFLGDFFRWISVEILVVSEPCIFS